MKRFDTSEVVTEGIRVVRLHLSGYCRRRMQAVILSFSLLFLMADFEIVHGKPATEIIGRETIGNVQASSTGGHENQAILSISNISGLIEIKENDIPDGSEVYVLEEPNEVKPDGEILETASNIVFRPLFRYRSKQEAQRRTSTGFRRRYFIPQTAYRRVYYPAYYNNRYYY